MSYNKKAQKNVLALVLVVFVFIILFIFVGKYVLGQRESSKLAKCQASLVVADRILEAPDAAKKALGLELDCQRITMHIEKKDAETDKAKREIAEKMVKFWQATEQGKMDPFKPHIVTGNKLACLIGYEITFDPKIGGIQGMKQYLEENTVKGTDQTYAEYLPLVMQDDIDTTQKYVIMWRSDKNEKTFLGTLALGSATGTALGATAGATFFGIGAIPGALLGLGVGTVSGTAAYFVDGKGTQIENTIIFLPEKAITGKFEINGEERPICVKNGLYN